VVDKLEKDGPKPDTVTYNELIRGYCDAGRLQDAKKVYDNLITNEYTPNKGTYGTLVPRLLQAGDLDCALRYCQDLLTRKGIRVAAGLLQDVMDALVEASRVEEATKLVELRQKKHYPRTGLRMPHTPTEDSELGAETDEEESISSEEKEREVEDETEK
jgi:pentatricopeptide repeat protein